MTPADLYPDVAARDSLAAALEAVAAEQGLVLGKVARNERQPLQYASVASETPLRESLGVTAGSATRCWVITGCGQGIWLIGGSTEDLAEVVRAAQLWRDGVPLRDIHQEVSFVELPEHWRVRRYRSDPLPARARSETAKHRQLRLWSAAFLGPLRVHRLASRATSTAEPSSFLTT